MSKATAILEERLALMAPARRLRLASVDETVRRWAGERAIRVLDGGCGDGLLSLSLAQRHPRWSIVGVDLRDDMLEGARARARARGLPNVRFRTADLTAPLPEEGFDAVLAIECLGEIPDDTAAMRTLVAALRPGGLFVAHVPEQSWRPVLHGAPTWREQARQGYTLTGMAAVLRRAGLERVDVRPTYRATATAAQEIRDAIKDAPVAARAAAFPALAAAVRLERWGLTGGRANALLAVGWRPAHST